MVRASLSRRLVRERGTEQFHMVVPYTLRRWWRRWYGCTEVFCGVKVLSPEYLEEQPPIEHACGNCGKVFRGVAKGMAGL